MEDLKYPIGKYSPQNFSSTLLTDWLRDIESLPAALEASITNLDAQQLATPYRENGWTISQVVHHVADSHMNAYIRFKLGLTEDDPAIKPYAEAKWAELPDSLNLPVNLSITLLFALHRRWLEVLKNISEANWQRNIFHPEHQKTMSLWYLLGMYAWHGRHHTAHINRLRERMSW